MMRGWLAWSALSVFMAWPVDVAAAPDPTGPGSRGHGSASATSSLHTPDMPDLHDLHVVYADLAVEGSTIAGRLRFFKEDLERALGPLVDSDAVSLAPGSEADALVLRYLRDRLAIHVDGSRLEPELIASGEDELDREAVWWIAVQYRSSTPVLDFTVRNTLLFELFDDQRNTMKFVHFPAETPHSFSFAAGEEEHRVRFEPGAR